MLPTVPLLSHPWEPEDSQPAVEGGGCQGQLLPGLPAPSVFPPPTHHPVCRAQHKAWGGGTAPALTGEGAVCLAHGSVPAGAKDSTCRRADTPQYLYRVKGEFSPLPASCVC